MKALIAATLCAIAVAMSLGYGAATRPIRGDNQLYFFMTERAASGVPPHLSHMEVKTQLPTLIGAAAVAAGRRLGFEDVPSGRAATTAAAALVSVLAWLLALELSGSAAAALVAGAATFAIHGLFVEAATGFQPKVFMMVFLLAGHLLFAQRRMFAAGAAATCAMLCWQPAGLVFACCMFAAVLDRRSTWRGVLALVAGATLVMLGYEAWFAWHGALEAQLHQEWALAFHVGEKHKPMNWVESVWFVATESQGYRSPPHPLPTIFVVVAALMWLGQFTRPRRALALLRDRPGLVSFWSAAHATMAFTLYDHQAHPDMLLVQPYFAVASGIAFGWFAALLARVRGGRAIVGLAAAACIAAWLQVGRMNVVRTAPPTNDGFAKQLAMARMVDLYRDHRGSIWALGSVHLLALNHMDNWTSVGNVGHETSKLDMATYRPLRDGVMPEIILSGRGLRPGAKTWLPKEYVDITPRVFADERIRVFSRRSPSQSGFEPGTAPKAHFPPRVPARPAPPSKPGAKPAAAPPAKAAAGPGANAAAMPGAKPDPMPVASGRQAP